MKADDQSGLKPRGGFFHFKFFENSNGSEINRCQFRNDGFGSLIDNSIQCLIKMLKGIDESVRAKISWKR